MSYISSFLASCFSTISNEDSFRDAMMKSKSSIVSTTFILVVVVLNFFWEESFGGETFLFFRGSTSSLGSVTSPCFYSSPLPFISSTLSSPPQSGDTEEVFLEALLKSWTSSVFFLQLVPGVFYSLWVASGLSSSGSDMSTGLANIRRYEDHSLVISSRSSSMIL
jgi:hypothetical protein